MNAQSPKERLPESVSLRSLTTGGPDDPFLPHLLEAIFHADEIELAVAFIRITGLRLIFDALAEALERGNSLKILTTDYLDVTDPEALRGDLQNQSEVLKTSLDRRPTLTGMYHSGVWVLVEPGS